MTFNQLHPLSFLAGSAVILLALVTMGQKPAAPEAWEYRIVIDVDEAGVDKLHRDGFVFEGYLGSSKLGSGSDETLWKRPAK